MSIRAFYISPLNETYVLECFADTYLEKWDCAIKRHGEASGTANDYMRGRYRFWSTIYSMNAIEVALKILLIRHFDCAYRGHYVYELYNKIPEADSEIREILVGCVNHLTGGGPIGIDSIELLFNTYRYWSAYRYYGVSSNFKRLSPNTINNLNRDAEAALTTAIALGITLSLIECQVCPETCSFVIEPTKRALT